ncbi:hypothetical protein ACIQ1H_01095 [Lysinibacillus sp. NPDC097279]|uniref:hypothetical protein n=1 Tax=Lysinibacillus sp. NPDC097279 TaxID=3364143 RepID=UPI0038270FEB
MNTVRFKYKFPENYNPMYVNGAHGGINPTGELVINFYFERHPIPYEEIRQIGIDGKLESDGEFQPEDIHNTFLRIINTGVIMNLDSAEIIHKWLGENIEIMKNKK